MNCDAAVPGARGTLGKQQTLSFCACFASVSNDLLFSVQIMRYTLEFATFKALPIITIKALARCSKEVCMHDAWVALFAECIKKLWWLEHQVPALMSFCLTTSIL
jgi:hypothetical protein